MRSESQMYTATVLADSLSPRGHRITTVRVVYPHAVHKDMLRHRCMNRNVESFRAQPPEKLIAALRDGHAFKPDIFAKRTKGMGQSSEEVVESEQASWYWDQLLKRALITAERLLELDIAKQQINFVLQDFCPVTEIITATDWSNFYALRTELNDDGTPVARPEVYKTAVAIRDAIDASTPQKLEDGWLHLPMISENELAEICKRREMGYTEGFYEVEGYWIHVSAGRCARISYGDFEWWKEDPAKSYGRAGKLLAKGHMSPFEQQAKPFSEARWRLVGNLQEEIRAMRRSRRSEFSEEEAGEMIRQLEYSGNLNGWVPARKTFPYEWDYGLLRENTVEEELV